MAASTPGPTAGTSKPKLERGAFAARQRAMRLMLSLATQAAIVLLLLLAAAFSEGQARWLSLWAIVVPVGFALVYALAYRRGERVRGEGRWTPGWEKAEARRGYAWLGGVVVLFVAGMLAVLALS